MKPQCVYKRIGYELIANDMDTHMLSDATGIPYQTLRRCIRGDSSFTLEDAISIHKAIGQHISIEELFERNDRH